jgi:hypothetical protein
VKGEGVRRPGAQAVSGPGLRLFRLIPPFVTRDEETGSCTFVTREGEEEETGQTVEGLARKGIESGTS